MNKGYEAGMKVTYEPRSCSVIISFRGRLTVLPGRFASEDDAICAGESFCRQKGWRPVSFAHGTVAVRSAW